MSCGALVALEADMQSGTVHGVSADYQTKVIPADAKNDSGQLDQLRVKLTRSGWLKRKAATVEGMPGAEVWIKLTPEGAARRLAETKAKAARVAKAKAAKAKPKRKRKPKADANS